MVTGLPRDTRTTVRANDDAFHAVDLFTDIAAQHSGADHSGAAARRLRDPSPHGSRLLDSARRDKR
jgi:hypothetical protein